MSNNLFMYLHLFNQKRKFGEKDVRYKMKFNKEEQYWYQRKESERSNIMEIFSFGLLEETVWVSLKFIYYLKTKKSICSILSLIWGFLQCKKKLKDF